MDHLTEHQFDVLCAVEMGAAKASLVKERHPDFEALADKGLIEQIWVVSDEGRKVIADREGK